MMEIIALKDSQMLVIVASDTSECHESKEAMVGTWDEQDWTECESFCSFAHVTCEQLWNAHIEHEHANT